MLFEGSNCAFGRTDTVIVGGNEVDVHVVAPDVGLTALEHSLSMTLIVGAYPHVLRVARMSLKAVIIDPSFFDGMA